MTGAGAPRTDGQPDVCICGLDALLAGTPPEGVLARCMDCKVLYSDFPLDTMLPDEQWRQIHNSEGGILCASCIVRRASRLPGAVAVRAYIEFVHAPDCRKNAWLNDGSCTCGSDALSSGK